MEGLPYVGSLSRAAAEELLTSHGLGEGSYFLRDRPEQPGEYVLVVHFQGHPTHHLVRRNKQGIWTINDRVLLETKSLKQLLEALSETHAVWPVVLRHPIQTQPVKVAVASRPALGGTDAPATQSRVATPQQVPASSSSTVTSPREPSLPPYSPTTSLDLRASSTKGSPNRPAPSPPRTDTAQDQQQPRGREELDDQWTADDEDFPPYVHGPLARDQADELLYGAGDGTFLFRERPEHGGEFVLSVVFHNRPTHHLIRWAPTGFLTVNGKQFGLCSTIPQLVEQLNAEAEDSWPARLLQPVSVAAVHPAHVALATNDAQPADSGTQVPTSAPVAPLREQERTPSTATTAAPRGPAVPPVVAAAAKAPVAAPDPPVVLRPNPGPVREQQQSSSGLQSARMSSTEEELAFWSVEDDAISLHSSSLPVDQKIVRGSTEPSTMVVAGRRGYASIINGVYERCGECHGLPAFRKADAQPMYLFYHLNNRSWAIAGVLGSNEVACFNHDTSPLPSMLRRPWRVSDAAGAFHEDPAVFCVVGNEKLSDVRLALQRHPKVHVSSTPIPIATIQELCRELASPTCKITHLKLFDNQLRPTDIKSLTDALKLNRSVTHLQLRSNGIGDNEAAMVADMIFSNPCLQYLSLRENFITDQGAKDLADALQANRSLVAVSFWGNELTEDGAGFLVSVLQTNKRLRGLRLFHNRVGSSALRRLQLRAKAFSPLCVVEIQPPRNSVKRRAMF